MYGKIFKDIYGSTLAEFGGDTMYVLMSMVVLSDATGYLRLTITSLARTIRKDINVVKVAINNLEADDPDSSCPDYQGRRIIKLSEITEGQENRGWWVVNKARYAKIASQTDRVDKNREAQQRFRDKSKNVITRNHSSSNVMDRNRPSSTVMDRNHPSSNVNRFPHVDKDVDVDVKIKRGRFAPPSLQEVSKYCADRKSTVDPQTFLDFYEANGWVQGSGKKIKSWEACVRTWESRDKKKSPTSDLGDWT